MTSEIGGLLKDYALIRAEEAENKRRAEIIKGE